MYSAVHAITTGLKRRAHCDGGSQVTTTNLLKLLWHYCEGTFDIHLVDVARHAHTPVRKGYLCIPTHNGQEELVEAYFTPTLEATILSPTALTMHFKCQGYVMVLNLSGTGCHLELQHCCRKSQNLHIALQYWAGLLYTDELRVLTKHECKQM